MSVTPPKPHDDLTAAAARLSKAAPNSWDEFIKALVAYTDVRRDACVQVTVDRVQIAQGKAQQCVELLSLLTTKPK